MSSSSSLFAERDFDVFFSCSCDLLLRKDLCYYLTRNGLKCFQSESWNWGPRMPIDQSTLKALIESKIVVVMFSEHRSSPAFLEELVVILDFQEKSLLTVLPVFLSDQRLYLEEIFDLYPERAEIWRAAMIKLDDISTRFSFSRKGIWKTEDYIRKLADEIWFILLSTPTINFYSLVGMDRQMIAFHELLALESDKEVRTIGIFGKSGVGKTTLARKTFEEISVSFQTHVFIDNVQNMKDKLLSEQNERGEDLISLDHERYEMNEAKEKHRKTLLIADDVDNIEQGNWIAEYAKCFAPGSRVILVSQNMDLLIQAGVKHVYEVRTLRYDEALKLFSSFAFKESYPPSDFEGVAVRAVQLAGFLPLTLRVFGLFLTGKSLKEWEDILLELNATKGKETMEVLKLMEALEDNYNVEVPKRETKLEK